MGDVTRYLKALNCEHWPKPGRWALLVTLSLGLSGMMLKVHVPAALLLGPMIAAVMLALAKSNLKIAATPYAFAQGLIGCMIARSIPYSVLVDVAADWPIFLGGVLSVILISNGLGWLMARRQLLPDTTAIWGFSPGAATAMTVMAEEYGADVRLVAFMQYLRVACVALAAAGIAVLLGKNAPGSEIHWFPPVDTIPLAATLGLAALATLITRYHRIPAGALMIPLIAGVLLHPVTALAMPPWLQLISYALLGWSIGLRFTRPILRHALGALPSLLAAIAVMIALCGLIALGLVHVAHVDPLTAYLATSPGGVDAVAIIAATSSSDMSFIMAMQTVRLILVLAMGPLLARMAADRLKHQTPREKGPGTQQLRPGFRVPWRKIRIWP